MAMAYVVVLVSTEMFDGNRRDSVAAAQAQADRRFENIAQEARLTLVTRNPEPRVMSHLELRKLFPEANLHEVVGLYFTADIT